MTQAQVVEHASHVEASRQRVEPRYQQLDRQIAAETGRRNRLQQAR